jgi:hypothetical protein
MHADMATPIPAVVQSASIGVPRLPAGKICGLPACRGLLGVSDLGSLTATGLLGTFASTTALRIGESVAFGGWERGHPMRESGNHVLAAGPATGLRATGDSAGGALSARRGKADFDPPLRSRLDSGAATS